MRRIGSRLSEWGREAPAAPQSNVLEITRLFEQHADYVQRTLLRCGVPRADVEDALQEVFLVVAHRLDSYVDLALGLVYVTTANNLTQPATDSADAFMAFELETGKVVFSTQWSSDQAIPEGGGRGRDFGANPVLYEAAIGGEMAKLMAAGQKTGSVHVVNRETGELVWSHDLGEGSDDGDQGILVNTAWSGKSVLVALNEGTGDQNSATLFALHPATGEILWERKLAADVLGRITIANGVGFVGAGASIAVFDIDNGKLIHEIQTGGATAAGTATIANGVVAFGTGAQWLSSSTAKDGKLVVLEVEP